MHYGLITRLEPVHRWAGAADRPAPVVALHGFTGGGEDFAPIASGLEREVLAPDLPGHGGAEAPRALAPYAMERVTGGLATLLDEQGLTRVALLGYSMGGRVALSFAARFPERVAAMVLIGASPGLEGEEERAARRTSDAALADRVEGGGVPAFLDYWNSLPIIATQARIRAPWRDEMRRRRLAVAAHGLANSLRGMGTGSMAPLWEALPAMAAPALLLTGEEDEKYCALAARMAALMPAATYEVIPGAGHCAHLERPEASLAAIRRFLDALPGPQG
jgi:2-succinyl-6-hydroxy-2,4-cyclohexadiene-1-carboxylate synthase